MSKKVKDIKGFDFTPFIKKLKEENPDLVLNQITLAKIVGCDNQTITNLKIKPSSSILTLLAICEYLDINPKEAITYKK